MRCFDIENREETVDDSTYNQISGVKAELSWPGLAEQGAVSDDGLVLTSFESVCTRCTASGEFFRRLYLKV